MTLFSSFTIEGVKYDTIRQSAHHRQVYVRIYIFIFIIIEMFNSL